MTNPSELVAKLPSRDEIAKLLFDLRQSGHDWETAIDGDPESDAGELASICREDADEVLVLISQSLAADTIDRLTSSGEAVAYRWMNAAGQLVYTSWKPTAAEALRRSVTPLYKHASPREGHVEVPDGMVLVPREADGAMATAAYKDQPGAINWSATQAWRTMVRAALPHNQGETKP